MCGKLWDGPWVGIGGCLSVRNGTLRLCGVFARPWVSEGGTVVEALGAMGFCVIVSLLAYGVPTANGSQRLIVIGTVSGGSDGVFVGVG